MRHLHFLLALLLFTPGLYAQLANTNAYTTQWGDVRRIPNQGTISQLNALPIDIKVDSQGNVYTLTRIILCDASLGACANTSFGVWSITKSDVRGNRLWSSVVARNQLYDRASRYYSYTGNAKLALDTRAGGNIARVSVLGEVFEATNLNNLAGSGFYYILSINLDGQTGQVSLNPDGVEEINWIGYSFISGTAQQRYTPVGYAFDGNGHAWAAVDFPAVTRLGNVFWQSHLIHFDDAYYASLGRGYELYNLPDTVFQSTGGGSVAQGLVVMPNNQALAYTWVTGTNNNSYTFFHAKKNAIAFRELAFGSLGDIKDFAWNAATQKVNVIQHVPDSGAMMFYEVDTNMTSTGAVGKINTSYSSTFTGPSPIFIRFTNGGALSTMHSSKLAFSDGNPNPTLVGLSQDQRQLVVYTLDRSGIPSAFSHTGATIGTQGIIENQSSSAISQPIKSFSQSSGYNRSELLYAIEDANGIDVLHRALDLGNPNPSRFTAAQSLAALSSPSNVTVSAPYSGGVFFGVALQGVAFAVGIEGQHADSTNTANLSFLYITMANNVPLSTPCHQGVSFAWNLPANICDTADAITLSATPAGGEFRLEGAVVTAFDPKGLTARPFTLTYRVTTSAGCDTTLTRTINVVACSAGDTIPADTTDPGSRAQRLRAQTSLYPNPAQGSVTLALPAGVDAQEVVLLTAQGQVVRRIDARLMGSELRIELGDLPAGLYFVRATTHQGTLSLPLQKL